MSRAVKTFISPVKERDGWPHKQAFVAIYSASESSQSTFESTDCKGHYVEGVSSHVIKYKASFWMDKAGYLSGLPSRPLFNKVIGDDGEEIHSEIFEVDSTNAQYTQVMNSNASRDDKTFTVIESDLRLKFS